MENYSLDEIEVRGGFYAERLELNRTSTLPSVYEQFKRTGRIAALKCDGTVKDVHIFWDSDVFKWLEGAVYALARKKDEKVYQWYDEIVKDVESNQREDGYFNSYFLTRDTNEIFQNRWNHELYCAGHLFEAAAAASRYLNDDRLLGVSKKYADYIRLRFMVKRDAAFVTPGHEEIEIALWRLYELTGDIQYKQMAEFFLKERGVRSEESDPLQLTYNQSHAAIYEQTEAAGHCVRALYLYTAMADMARIDRDETLADVVKRLYEDIVGKRMYVTGGLGSAYEGERFANEYFLPNSKAYSETCASIALMTFCNEMIRLTGEKKYADTLERAFYNCVLAGVSLNGSAFFYVNPLEVRINEIRYNEACANRMPEPLAERRDDFFCSCCPPNLLRIIERFPSYAFYRENGVLAVEQFLDADLNSDEITVEMRTDFPYGGKVRLCIDSRGKNQTVKVRVPDWCGRSFSEAKDGYLVYEGVFDRKRIEIDFAPKLQKIYPNPKIDADFGKVCFGYGPMILCAESADNADVSGVAVRDISEAEICADGKYILKAKIPAVRFSADSLYSYSAPKKESIRLNLIPYFAHANRGEADMKVWFTEFCSLRENRQ